MVAKSYKTVKVEKEDGITWVILNRPEKRNAMKPQMHYDMFDCPPTIAGAYANIAAQRRNFHG